MSSKRQATKRSSYYRARAAIYREFERASQLTSMESTPQKGERVRVFRRLVDPTSVGKIALKLDTPHREGIINKKSPSRMAITVLDTVNYRKQQIPSHDHTTSSARFLLRTQMPGLFEPFTAEVKGMRLFGNHERPCIALTFASDFLDMEGEEVARTLFPDLPVNRAASHLTVARAFSRERAVETMRALEDCLPKSILFAGALTDVGLQERPR